VSRAFTKDDDAGEPPLVPLRPPLPLGVPNYVTPRGLGALRGELRELLSELAKTRADAGLIEPDPARVQAANVLSARVTELEGRIGSAELVPVPDPAPHEIRFGATVTVRSPGGTERAYLIVGVDEAKATEGRIAFVAPLARALLGKRVGDAAVVRTPHGDEELEIVKLEYEPSVPTPR
jgi:transcription elongation factor GreB